MNRQHAASAWNDWSSLGKMMVLIGGLRLVPLTMIPFYPADSQYLSCFLLPSALSAILGGAIWIRCSQPAHVPGFCRERENRPAITRRSSLIVLAAWIWAFVAGALPFILAGLLRPVPALFEAVSGWTTTGLSAMDVAAVPKIFLFHRSFMQFCGGLGFVMMMVIATSGTHDIRLFESEGHPDQLMPGLKRTARTVLALFAGFLAVGTLALTVCGMSWFDAVNHAMCALSTGGFSTRAGSIGEYQSLSIDLVTIVLMLIGTTNFAVLLLLAKGRIRQILKVTEVRFMTGLLVVAIGLLAWILYSQLHLPWQESLQKAAFDAVSALSTTGFSSMSYADWPAAAIGLLMVLMVIGGGMGSTAGGIKLLRICLASKALRFWTRRQVTDSSEITPVTYVRAQGKTTAFRDLIRSVFGYIGLYLAILVTGTLLICLISDLTLTDSFFDFASSLGTVGLSMGATGPQTADGVLLVEMAGMLLGRLEILIVFKGVYSLKEIISQRLRKPRFPENHCSLL